MTKPLYVPGPGVPRRTPQLLRDRMPVRPGVPEAIEKVPPWIALPLLFGKAHSEIHEATLAPLDPEEYGDVRDVLEAIAEACGHPWEAVAEAAAKAPQPEAWTTRDTAGQLHGAVEEAALDLGNPARIAAALRLAIHLAALNGVEWNAVEASSAQKRARRGGFTGHMFWRAID